MKGNRIIFGELKDSIEIPDLIEIQLKSFDDFLQKEDPSVPVR